MVRQRLAPFAGPVDLVDPSPQDVRKDEPGAEEEGGDRGDSDPAIDCKDAADSALVQYVGGGAAPSGVDPTQCLHDGRIDTLPPCEWRTCP
ncbi:MAG: hypothetical protein D6692_09785 [Planctomycetota bacterium]|nr:MAG: hypothetical protein D6692_09785 [Planctomycetota bacterium]